MSEPKERAARIEELGHGVFHWWCHDDRIDSRSEAYAVRDDAGRLVLIDPLPIDRSLLLGLGEVEAIVLSAGNHQRSAWRFRSLFEAPVWAPVDAHGLEQPADHAYSGGDLLPGRLVAVHTPGPVESMHALWLNAGITALFLSDLLVHEGDGRLRFVEGTYQDEPDRTRDSIRRLRDQFPAELLCFAHGPPLSGQVRHRLTRSLRDDGGAASEEAPL